MSLGLGDVYKRHPDAIANAVRIVLNRDLALSIAKPKTLTWTESFANFAQLLQKF
mgnify:CR=1 FL=1